MHNAWRDGEAPTVDEQQFTHWAEPGWEAWNPHSPELWFCETAAKLAEYRGGLVIETGAGQGYITRRVAKVADEYLVYESDPRFRHRDVEGATVPDEPTFSVEDIKRCNLLIIDSATEFRMPELQMWNTHAPDDCIVLMHDAGNGHENYGTGFTHLIYWRMVTQLRLPGIKYKNPRGALLSWKAEPSEEDLDFYRSLGPNELVEYA